MADFKTIFREISVLVGLVTKTEGRADILEPNSFFSLLNSKLTFEEQNGYSSVSSIRSFDKSVLDIIKNGYLLADYIISKLEITNIESMKWLGYEDNPDLPYDIEVNGLLFSLKEDSFILENMGLYKLLNCFTGSSYNKRHIFEDYAMDEYMKWFDVTWSKLINYLKLNNEWSYSKKKKNSKILLETNKIKFSYINDSDVKETILPKNCKLQTFKDLTNGDLREQVFSKFINQELKDDSEYIFAKRNCSVVASENVVKELLENLNYKSGISRFLRFHEHSYYYAKVSNGSCHLYFVDSEKNFTNDIRIISICPSVPSHQANIITTIKNIKNNKILVLRNELRFSHGQFNGTPEAKLYIADGDLLSIYKEI